MPLSSGIFLFFPEPSSEIDAESETDRMHLSVARGEKWQEGIAGEEADVVTTHAERSVQFESVDT